VRNFGIRREQSGQVAVESAIILPMFVFLMLGLLQYGLMQQARVLAKFGAYRAVRAGALFNANVGRMREAGMAAVLPLIADTKSGGPQGSEYYYKIAGAGDVVAKWWMHPMNFMPDAMGIRYVDVTTCGPLKNDVNADFKNAGRNEVDFDDPAAASGDDMAAFTRTKLRIQLTFNYRMPIPFANWIIHKFWMGQQILRDMHLGKQDWGRMGSHLGKYFRYYAAANFMHVYVIPIRATYAMRMQSNLFKDNLPDSNSCEK
jgi:hypothetical protein